MSRLLLPFKVCWRYLKRVLRALDRSLVFFATPFGVRFLAPWKQYATFFAVYTIIYVLAFLQHPIPSFIALIVGYIGVLAVGRAWVKNENKRTAIAKKLEVGKPNELPDLRGLALASALQLFLLFPLLFRQCQNTFSLYTVHGEASFLTWFWFALDKTYLKALPDWSVLYKVHISSIDFESRWGQHLVLFTRLTFDFILIQGLKRLYDIHLTIRDGVAAVKNDPQMAVLLGNRAVEPLILALKDEDARFWVADALGQLGDVRAVEPLIVLLKDRSSNVRDNAARALGQLGDIRAVGPLSLALNDQDVGVRTRAASALGRLGDVRAFEPLILAVREESGIVRDSAAGALGQLGDLRAVGPLILALKDEDVAVRTSAAGALGRLGDVRAVEPLILALTDDHEHVRSGAAEALQNVIDVRAVEPLILALRGVQSLSCA